MYLTELCDLKIIPAPKLRSKATSLFKKIDWTRSHHLHLQWKFNLLAGKWENEVIRQNIAGWCQQTFCIEKFVDSTQQCSAVSPQANFPAHNLNFYWRWRGWDWIQTIFLKSFLLYSSNRWKTEILKISHLSQDTLEPLVENWKNIQ